MTKTEFQERAGYETKGIAALLWQTADEVAEAALAASAKGSPLCTPGVQNKVAATATHFAPRRFQARVAGLISRQV